jgi:AcrR family transcriptional regulator
LPRAGLTRQRVIAEAAAAADEAGLERLTMASVAHRLGVSLPALYKHVDSIAELRRDLAVLGVRELTAAMTSGGPRDPCDAVPAGQRTSLAQRNSSTSAHLKARCSLSAAAPCPPSMFS